MKKKSSEIRYFEGVGRRKRAVARVRLYLTDKEGFVEVNGIKIKKGEIFVNSKPLEQIYLEEYEREFIKNPLKLANSEDRFAISVLVKGGGNTGQKEAIIHGLSRALVLYNKDYKTILRKNGLLTRDPRKKERRKVGTGGKARREKQSPKR